MEVVATIVNTIHLMVDRASQREGSLQGGCGAAGRLFRGFSEPIDPPLYSRRHLINYLAQVLSAFKAVSADAFVE